MVTVVRTASLVSSKTMLMGINIGIFAGKSCMIVSGFQSTLRAYVLYVAPDNANGQGSPFLELSTPSHVPGVADASMPQKLGRPPDRSI